MGCGSTKAPQAPPAVPTPPKAVVRPRRIGSAKTQVAVVLPGSYNKLLLEPLGMETAKRSTAVAGFWLLTCELEE